MGAHLSVSFSFHGRHRRLPGCISFPLALYRKRENIDKSMIQV